MKAQLCIVTSLAGTLYSVLIYKALSLEALKTFLATFFVVLASKQAYWIWIYPYYVSPLRHLPGPKDHHFLIGQALNQFYSGAPNEPYISWMRQWPEAEMIRYFSFGNSETILITGLNACREILSVNSYSFVKPVMFEKLVGAISGKGLVFAEGEEHKKQRRLIAGAFSLTRLKKLIPGLQKKSQQLSNYVDEQIRSHSGIVELAATYSSVALDIIGVAVLGVDLQNLETPTSFHEFYRRVFDPSPLGQVLIAINLFFPIRWIPIDENWQFKRATAETRRLLREIVRQRIKDLTAFTDRENVNSDANHRDILTYMIRETFATDTPWTEDDILGHILNMMAAGHETVASSLVWATYALVENPEVQKRLRAEILTMLKNTPSPGYTEIEGLQYLNNFCREVLRLYSPAVTAFREADQDVNINGIRIPKGTNLIIMPSTIHLNPRIWGDSAKSFDPDRWERKPIDPQAFATFLQGPRNCIGRVFAMLEIKIILIDILSKFHFEVIQPESIVLINPSILLRPKGGIKVKVSRLG